MRSEVWSLIFTFGGVVPTGIFALFAVLAFVERRAWRAAIVWPLCLLVAVAVGAATKVVYYGWGIEYGLGVFRGFSGHTLRAAAVYPTFVYSILAGSPRYRVIGGLAFGSLIAGLVLFAAVHLRVHTLAEAVAGAITGAIAVWLACGNGGMAPLRGSTQLLIVVGALLLAIAMPPFRFDLEQVVVDFAAWLRHGLIPR